MNVEHKKWSIKRASVAHPTGIQQSEQTSLPQMLPLPQQEPARTLSRQWRKAVLSEC